MKLDFVQFLVPYLFSSIVRLKIDRNTTIIDFSNPLFLNKSNISLVCTEKVIGKKAILKVLGQKFLK